jgi:CheY-like chemotaxis protein
MSGSALIGELRRIRPDIPVLLVSGYLNDAAMTRALDAGAQGVLRKPATTADLAASLARVLHLN